MVNFIFCSFHQFSKSKHSGEFNVSSKFPRISQSQRTQQRRDPINNVPVGQYEEFIESRGHISPTWEDIEAFSNFLTANNEDTVYNYYALLEYGSFTKNEVLCNSVIERLGADDALDNLYREVESILETERILDRV